MTSDTWNLRPHLAVAVLALSALAGPAQALEIALTNDDGWSAAGIQAMKDALRSAGHTVTLAGPLANQSGSGAAVDLGALRIVKRAPDEYSVALVDGVTSAKPATSGAVAIAIVQEKGRNPDLVVSGINAGANVGSFTQVSGTVGATILSVAQTFAGTIPAIAISTDEPAACGTDAACKRAHYDVVADFLVRFIAHLETRPGFLNRESALLPPGVALNINHPPLSTPRGVKIAVQGQTALDRGREVVANFRCGAGGSPSCSSLPVGGISIGAPVLSEQDLPDVKNSDTDFFADGYITIVPITPDYTADSPFMYKSLLTGFNP